MQRRSAVFESVLMAAYDKSLSSAQRNVSSTTRLEEAAADNDRLRACRTSDNQKLTGSQRDSSGAIKKTAAN